MFLRRKIYIFIVLYELNEIASDLLNLLYNLLCTWSLPELYHEYVYHVSNIFTQIAYLDKQFQQKFDNIYQKIYLQLYEVMGPFPNSRYLSARMICHHAAQLTSGFSFISYNIQMI